MIETKVEGSPGAVRTAAHFLESTLKRAAASAADEAAAARRSALASWEGGAADAYLNVSSKLIDAADEQARHASDAGLAFEEYAGRLEGLQERMEQRRWEARAGGLLVTGTIIESPSDVLPPDLTGTSGDLDASRWDLENAAFEVRKQKVVLYHRLAEEVSSDWETFRAWIDSRLKRFWQGKQQPALAELMADALSKVPGAAAGASLDFHARTLDEYAEGAASRSKELTREAAEARAALRSGNPARRAAGEAVDTAMSRRAAEALAEAGQDARWIAKGLPVLGYAISFGSDGYAIAHGDAPGKVVGGEVAGIGAGLATAAFVAGAPVLVTVGAAIIVGGGASLLADYTWDHWVPEGAKDAIDQGLEDFGNGVKDVAGDVGDALTFWD